MGGVVTLEDFTVEPEWESEFVRAWKECALHARQAAGRGHIWWLLRDGDRAGHYVGVSEWDSSDSLEYWRRVPRYPEVVNHLRGLGSVGSTSLIVWIATAPPELVLNEAVVTPLEERGLAIVDG